jgi:hypothetical protein
LEAEVAHRHTLPILARVVEGDRGVDLSLPSEGFLPLSWNVGFQRKPSARGGVECRVLLNVRIVGHWYEKLRRCLEGGGWKGGARTVID